MISDKQSARSFLAKLKKLCERYNANITGEIAFYDGDSDIWSDWLELNVDLGRAYIKYVGPDEYNDELSELNDLKKELNSLIEILKEKTK